MVAQRPPGPRIRPPFVLAAALLLCLPILPRFVAGTVSAAATLTWLLLALLGSWAGGGLLGRVLAHYGALAEQNERGRPSTTGSTAPGPASPGRASAADRHHPIALPGGIPAAPAGPGGVPAAPAGPGVAPATTVATAGTTPVGPAPAG